MAGTSGSSTALTGRLGAFFVNNSSWAKICRATQWKVDPKLSHTSEWGDSDSGGYTNRAPGRLDGPFNAEGKFDTGTEQFNIFFPGDIVASCLYMNLTTGWMFPRALNTGFSLSVNIDSEEVIGWTSEWGPDGIFYMPGQSGAPALPSYTAPTP